MDELKKWVLYLMDGLSVWEIFVIFIYMAMQLVGWICLIADTITSLIECIKCSRRKTCEYLIFSEHCPKRHCLNEEERRQLRKKIKELD